MRFSKLVLIFLVLSSCLVLVLVQGKVDSNELGVMSSINSFRAERAECRKKVADCKEGSKENVLEDEDYIYTNSLP
ncbi:hypothetical protein RchiOBHm_Chr2g0116151 [Rosa chinensis]|uniref:Phytosulfokine-beta n=1 Tax=Rosa chinensis TaxID=74649 RepID=A0A2P6RR70_ROSCH|nr:hypothetical protein RchiOBHm_Chr2g0116151 [Rosa chinensis]